MKVNSTDKAIKRAASKIFYAEMDNVITKEIKPKIIHKTSVLNNRIKESVANSTLNIIVIIFFIVSLFLPLLVLSPTTLTTKLSLKLLCTHKYSYPLPLLVLSPTTLTTTLICYQQHYSYSEELDFPPKLFLSAVVGVVTNNIKRPH